MISVGELIERLTLVEKEYGSDTSVVIRFQDKDENVINGEYLQEVLINKAGTVFLVSRDY